jgi:Ca2+-transporting ATPase
MAVLCSNGKTKSLVAKGTAERIIKFSNLKKADKDLISEKVESLSSEGYKVIALAFKDANSATGSALKAMTFLGLFALVDEPTIGIADTLKQVIAAGIRPIILTGDHHETARFIANKVGLNVADDEIIDDAEFHALSHAKLVDSFKKVKIFARISPEDKLTIVKALQASGYSVAVTGDGVNDAPALKEAYVGIAMGIKGTDIAKDSADIVLSDDKYKTILSAIEYGRTIHDNIKNIVAHLISGNLNEIALVGVAFAFGLPSPITTLQILWINLITETIPALAFSFELPRKNVLQEKPRSNTVSTLKPTVWYAISLAIVAFILCLCVFLYGVHISTAKAQAITFTFFVFIKLAFSFSLRSKERIWQNPRSFFENKYLIGATVISAIFQMGLFIEPFKSAFKLVSLNLEEKLVLISLVIFAFFVAELIRYSIDKHANAKLT